ncbi:hypothetical protein B0J13DRAFT_214126 [Dactylonectria estremocensis]|uniref:Secreted protein n=1 Tax=Dactylonectria estremocensis TaxID=1079267 RepID=A0A9P9F666_9HYPO|nr:hypothetical protein B0J13DRAFT_214126 [Dactylonectria estremocensis]
MILALLFTHLALLLSSTSKASLGLGTPRADTTPNHTTSPIAIATPSPTCARLHGIPSSAVEASKPSSPSCTRRISPLPGLGQSFWALIHCLSSLSGPTAPSCDCL